MEQNPFAPHHNDLPETLPVFPLSGVLLLPFGQLPLNIFEPRYLAMINTALRTHRMIGMIQPKESNNHPPLYETGCAGKITEFAETDDGRYLISLTGICRFKIKHELEITEGYRIVKPLWNDFEKDMTRQTCLDMNREKLKNLLINYFEQENMDCDFDKFDNIPDGKLMTCLSMICPFEPREKQALLEQTCCASRAKLFLTMLEMAIQSGKKLDKDQMQCH